MRVFHSLPFAFLCALGFALLLEVAGRWRAEDSDVDALLTRPLVPPGQVPFLEESILQWKIIQMYQLREPQRVLLLGDSTCLMNIDAQLLTERLGVNTWNLGTFAWLANDGLLEIMRLYLRHHMPPELLVLHLSAYSMGDELDHRRHAYWMDRLRLWTGGTHGLLLSGTQSLRDFCRFEFDSQLARLRGLSPEAARDQAWAAYPSDRGIEAEMLALRGSLVCRDSPSGANTDPLNSRGMSKNAKNAMRELRAVCAAHNIRILFVLAPLPASLEGSSRLAGVLKLRTELLSLADEDGRFILANPILRYCIDSDCLHKGHVTKIASQRYSEELALVIAPLLRQSTVMP